MPAPEWVQVEQESSAEVDRIVLARYAPPGVVVDEQMEILEFRGNINAYLKPRRGRSSLNLLKMARDELVLALRVAVEKARKSGRPARWEDVAFETGPRVRQVNLEVIPLKKLAPARYLVVFEPAPTSLAIKRQGTESPTPEVKRLRRELAVSRVQSQAVLEQHEATVQAMQTVSEEFQSNNEELQSVNEELETSKEELESSNEELNTLNEEMAARNVELDRLNTDLNQRELAIRLARDYAEAIIATVPEPLVILDGRLRVQTANPAYYEMFGGSPGETEHHSLYELSNGAWDVPALRTALAEVLVLQAPIEDFEIERDFAPLGWRTMLLNARPVGRTQEAELILLVIADITERKRAAEVLQRSHEELEATVRQRTAELTHAHAELLLVEERERRRLAVDLHDGLCQTLNLLSMNLHIVKDSAKTAGLEQPLQGLRQLVTEAGRQAHDLTFEISPPVLHDLGLEAALHWLAEYMERRYRLTVAMDDDGPPKPLDEPTRILLYRSVRELLINAAKHSQVNKASVAVRQDGTNVMIVVADAGAGFDPAMFKVKPSGGLGLFSVRERLHHLGGRIEIQSSPGKGTRIILTAPLHRDNPQTSGAQP